MTFITIGYDPVQQRVVVGPMRENAMAARFAAKLSGIGEACLYTTVFNLGSAGVEDYVSFFNRCGVPYLAAVTLTREVAQSMNEALAGEPLTQAYYARRFDVL